jgi:hypothetical protein
LFGERVPEVCSGLMGFVVLNRGPGDRSAGLGRGVKIGEKFGVRRAVACELAIRDVTVTKSVVTERALSSKPRQLALRESDHFEK